MNSVELVRRLHEHRAWVNHNLLAAAAPLSDATRRQPFAIGQGSIWKSLVHLYAAEYVWLACLLGNEQAVLPGDRPDKLPGNQEAEGGIGSFDELATKWSALDERWQTYLQALNEADFDQRIPKVSSAGARSMLRRADILLHVCTHAHYTAAQVVNMLRQAGASPLPETMLITLARAQAAAS